MIHPLLMEFLKRYSRKPETVNWKDDPAIWFGMGEETIDEINRIRLSEPGSPGMSLACHQWGRFRHGENMSAELIGILSLSVALPGLILTAALWIGGWLRDVDRRLAWLGERVARLEGLIESLGPFRKADTPAPAPTGD